MIRRGTVQDIEAAVKLGRRYFDEAPFAQFMDYDEAKAKEVCRAALQSFALVAEEENELIGFMGAALHKQFFSETLLAMDYLIYVAPEHRGKGIARQFINTFIEWALASGVQKENIFLGIDSGIHTAQTEEFYKSLGFVRCGVKMRYGR